MNIPFSFWKTASPKRKRIYSIIFMLILIIATTLLGTLVQLSAQDAKQLTDDVNKITTDNPTYASRVETIFLNNFSLSLLMFIPFVGAALGLFIMFSSGIGIRAIFDTQSASAASAQLTNISPTTANHSISVYRINIRFRICFLLNGNDRERLAIPQINTTPMGRT